MKRQILKAALLACGSWVAACNVQAQSNMPPTVSLSSPVSGSAFSAPAAVTIAATAADSDGTIAKVEYYNGATLLGTSTAAPYSFTWSNVAAGSYNITAKAYDNAGAATLSAARPITVTVGNLAPAVSLTSPANGAVLTAGVPLTLTASASDRDGAIAKVEFYLGGFVMGVSTAAPYTLTSPAPGAGTYTFTAKAYDNNGAVTESAPISFTLKAANVAPTVSLTAPAANATYTAPAAVTITANAADSDGTISKVEYYNAGTLLGTSTSAPYSFTWGNVAAGGYRLIGPPICGCRRNHDAGDESHV